GEALAVRWLGVAALAALAWTSGRPPPFVAATDAGRREVFWARYADRATRIGDIAVDRPADVDTGGLPVLGHGARLYADVFGQDPGAAAPLYPPAAAPGRSEERRA